MIRDEKSWWSAVVFRPRKHGGIRSLNSEVYSLNRLSQHDERDKGRNQSVRSHGGVSHSERHDNVPD